jgi:hypothetical protein
VRKNLTALITSLDLQSALVVPRGISARVNSERE